MEVYAYLDGRILFDPACALSTLTDEARARFENYATPQEEREKISYWLKSARLKMEASLAAEGLLKATYYSSTQSWPILTGLWAANNKPLPPSGAVWAHLKDLSRGPRDIEMRLQQLFLGDASCRIQTAIDLINWITAVLDQGADTTASSL